MRGIMGKVAALVAAASMLFGGASAAFADGGAVPQVDGDVPAMGDAPAAARPARAASEVNGGSSTVSNVTVSDVGAHSANIGIDYSIDPELMPQVESVCFVASVGRVWSVKKGLGALPGWASGPEDYDCDSGVSDTDMTQADYRRIYGTKSTFWTSRYESVDGKLVDAKKDVKVADFTYQSFWRYYKDSWDGKASGHFDLSLVGLRSDSVYANSDDEVKGLINFVPNNLSDLMLGALRATKKTGVRQSSDLGRLYAGMRIKLKDGSVVPFYALSKPIPTIRTTAEPSGSSEGDLDNGNKGDVSVPDGTVTSGSKARVYVNQLKEDCKAKVDAGQGCFWYSYVYSTAQRLTDPSGTPNVRIQKDDEGRYYYDAYIPAGFSGTHRIALADADGKVQGWTSLNVKASKNPFTDVNGGSPHAQDIFWAADAGIAKGYEDGTFGGMRTVVRQDMAAFLYRLAGSPAFDETKAENPFKDVNSKTPHYKEILWLYSTGITTGYDDGTFGGGRTVVRQDMAAFLNRYADHFGAKAVDGPAKGFSDVSDRTPHAAEIAWLAKTGVTTGYDDGTFGSMRSVVRQDMAAFLNRMNLNVLE